jgi:2-polyprenyl-3-methyl-5-hydroxy-6-metoxy-1,4-benzoquinol methylase
VSAPVEELLEYVRSRHPRSLAGVEEARAVDPARFDAYANLLVGWARRALGEQAVARTVDAFVRFSFEVNLAQARYEAAGCYENKSYAECYAGVYNERETMDDYLWGVFLTNFLWAHHMDISTFYEDRFLVRLPAGARLVEIAPGHGGWGLMALHALPSATLEAYDISPSSIAIAGALAEASGLQARARYSLRNALELDALAPAQADAVICNFLIEHLEEPPRLLEVIQHLLRPGALAFVSGALTAAQVDHIHEFRRESELVALAERFDLRALETISVAPRRTLPGARFLPRSMALILEKPTGRHRRA